MKFKIKWQKLIICILIPLGIGAIAGFISKDSMSQFAQLNQPPLSPPGWLFPVAWTILYTLMGIGSYLVLTAGATKADISKTKVKKAMCLYGLQLLFNFCWTFWFFNLQLYFFAFAWLLVLWVLILVTMVLFWQITKPAGYTMLPYLLWVTFAAYLNLGIALLN